MVDDDPVLTADNLFMPFISPNAGSEKNAEMDGIVGDHAFYPNPTNRNDPPLFLFNDVNADPTQILMIS